MAEKYPESLEHCESGDQASSTEDKNTPETELSESESPEQHQSRQIDQSASAEEQQQGSFSEDKHGLVAHRPITSVDVDQSDTTGGHHGQVSDQTDFADLLQQFPQALQLPQTGAATVNLIQTQYIVSGDKAVIQGTQHNVAGRQTVIEGDHNIATITTNETQPLTSENPQGRVEMLNLDKCQEELRTCYLEDYGRVNLLLWIPEETREMESIFVDLELVRKGQSYHKIECSEELVNLKRNRGQRENRVLITGDAGGGKSTLLANIAYKWALNDPQSPVSKFSLVFLLRMKDIESSSSLVDLIFENILPDDSTVSKEGLGIYIKENAGDILFLIDGLDEDTCDVLKNKSGEVAQLLHYRIQRKSCVILTSRPEYISNLKEHIRYYLQVKLEGFSSSSIIEYMNKFFCDDEDKIASLLEKLYYEPHILALISIPVLLLMICVLWEDQSRMLKTKTQLYIETIRYLWKRSKVRETSGDPFIEDSEAEELQEDCKELLTKLGEVALENTSISDDNITFTESDFGSYFCNLGCEVGILKKERTRSGIARKTYVTFLHATFQDFCAAFYLAFLLESQETELNDFHGKLFEIQSYDTIYRPRILEFCCGLHPQTTAKFFQYNLTKKQERVDSITHNADESKFDMSIDIHLANIFESQYSYDQCAKLFEIIPRSFSLHLEIDHSGIANVLYLLDLYKDSESHTGILSAINKLDVNELMHTPPWIADLLTYTTSLQVYIGFVSSSSTSADRDKLYRALSMLPNLSHVNLNNANLIPPTSPDITNLITLFKEKGVRLVTLSLVAFQYNDKVMVRYLSSIKTSIAQLTLRSSPFIEEHVITAKEVFPILHTLKQLSTLDLSFIQISLSGIKYLRSIIGQLEDLTLMGCRLKEKHLKELLTINFLSRAKKLRKLNLSFNDGLFSGSLVDTFVGTMNQLPALEELYVYSSGLSEESERSLLKFAKEKPSMRVLGIYCY